MLRQGTAAPAPRMARYNELRAPWNSKSRLRVRRRRSPAVHECPFFRSTADVRSTSGMCQKATFKLRQLAFHIMTNIMLSEPVMREANPREALVQVPLPPILACHVGLDPVRASAHLD
jgi:hypothetical protein